MDEITYNNKSILIYENIIKKLGDIYTHNNGMYEWLIKDNLTEAIEILNNVSVNCKKCMNIIILKSFLEDNINSLKSLEIDNNKYNKSVISDILPMLTIPLNEIREFEIYLIYTEDEYFIMKKALDEFKNLKIENLSNILYEDIYMTVLE